MAQDGGQRRRKVVEVLSFDHLFITNPRNKYIANEKENSFIGLEGNRQGKAEVIRAENLFGNQAGPESHSKVLTPQNKATGEILVN